MNFEQEMFKAACKIRSRKKLLCRKLDWSPYSQRDYIPHDLLLALWYLESWYKWRASVGQRKTVRRFVGVKGQAVFNFITRRKELEKLPLFKPEKN